MSRFECPPEHDHAKTSTCRSLHHCKCVACTDRARRYENWRQAQRRKGRQFRVPAIGSVRRIRALQRLGWSYKAIGEHMGYSESWPMMIARQTFVSPRTAAKVREVYDALSMRLPTPRTKDERAAVTKTRRYAER